MYGTHTTLDTLAASQQSVAEFGEDRAFDAIEAYLNVHNTILRELMATLVDITDDRQRRYGGLDTMTMEKVNQFGRPDAQKIAAGATVGFPLEQFEGSLQWTRKALQVMPAREMAAAVDAMTAADRTTVQREIRRALFSPTNYTFDDVLIDNVQLAVKRLANADGAVIPLGPNGETFNGATHTHYLATGALVAADITALINTVIEHFGAGNVLLYINRAQETAVRAMTANFTPYTDARLINQTAGVVARGALDQNNPNNRAIGIFNEAEVWVKPSSMIPANYMASFVSGGQQPLVFRERNPGSGNLVLVAEDELHPLRARTYEREFGVGAWNRVAAAVLRTDNATYAAPSF